jgi:hypothetical protein
VNEKDKHIDRSFRKSLKQYQEKAPEGVWNGIRDMLNQDRRKARIVWIGRVAAAAAFILAAGSIWILFQRTPDSELGRVQESITEQQGTPGLDEDSTPVEARETPQAEQEFLLVPEEDAQIEEQENLQAAAEDTPGEEQEILQALAQAAEETPLKEEEIPRVLADDAREAGIPQEIQGRYIYSLPTGGSEPGYTLAVKAPVRSSDESTGGIDVFEEFGDEGYSEYNKWAVGGLVSPIYSYRTLDASVQSPTANQYYNGIENGIVSYSGGVNLNYSPLKRLSVQSGLYYSRLGLSIPNTYLTTINQEVASIDFSLNQLAMTNSSGQIELGHRKDDAFLATNMPTQEQPVDAGPDWSDREKAKREVKEGELLQHFKYLEIPLILRYRLVDKRVGLNLLGGLSTNFLVGNSVYFKEGGSREYLGTTEDIKLINYSSIVGVGFQYSISRNLHINMEPTFRYYLNSINTATGIGSHPYSLGFFTGLSYSF